MPQTAIALMSGGLDSTTLVWSLRPDVKALLVDYDQRHITELNHAQQLCHVGNIEFEIADIRAINKLIAKGSQSGSEQPPEGHYTEMSMKTTIVPNRNSIILAIAVRWVVQLRHSGGLFA